MWKADLQWIYVLQSEYLTLHSPSLQEEIKWKKKHEKLTNFWLREVRPLGRESYISENVQNDQV